MIEAKKLKLLLILYVLTTFISTIFIVGLMVGQVRTENFQDQTSTTVNKLIHISNQRDTLWGLYVVGTGKNDTLWKKQIKGDSIMMSKIGALEQKLVDE